MASLEAFRDNAVLLTGASRGIGRELALQLADVGARLGLAARSQAELAEVAEACRSRGAGSAVVLPADVAREDECRRLVDDARSGLGAVDTLILNAGISMWALFEEVEDLSIFDKIMRVNYFGCVYLTHFALPDLVASGGRIVGVSSLTGKTGVPTRSGYAASKHAMAGFFDTLRIELGPRGVTVTMAYPDFVATNVRRSAFGADGRPLGTSPVQEGRIMTAEVCARRILVAAAGRKREIVMSTRGRIGQWLKLLAPSVIDRIARRAIERGR